MSRITFAMRQVLLFLPVLVNGVATQFPLDTSMAPSSGMSVASETKRNIPGFQDGQQYDAASLESMALGMAELANTPEVQQGMVGIEQIVNDTLLTLYGNYRSSVNQEPLLYAQWKASTDRCNYTKHGDASLPSQADAHLACRQQQSAIQNQLEAATECSPAYQQSLVGLRYARCNNFWEQSNVFPSDVLPDSCKRAAGEVNQQYIARVVDRIAGLRTSWTDNFAACQQVIDSAANTSTVCSDLTAQLANKTAECDRLQQTLDATSCNLAQGVEAGLTCGEFEACWKAANDTYIRENASIATATRDTEGEIRSMKRVRCIARALTLPQGDIDEALEVCQRTIFTVDECLEDVANGNNWSCFAPAPINYSFYLEDWNPPNTPTLPPANCTGGVSRPCTPSYVNTYFTGLPANAPAAPSTVDCCTRCEYFDACGSNLTRPNYKSIRGFDEATCCLKASWRISAWAPALFGDVCPTSCGHTASIYSRSIECVSEIGTVVPDSECVRLQGPKKITELRCSPTATCSSCSACGWGYERQGCDPQANTFGTCVPCQKNMGSYFARAGSCDQLRCGTCSTGQYLAGCEFSFGNAGSCTPCTAQNGTFFTGAGAFVDFSCPTGTCTACPRGKYNAGCSGTSAGTCSDCTGANTSGVGFNEYFSGPGQVVDVSTSCPKKLCDYTRCQFGQVLDNCAGGNPGTCVDCQPVCSQFRTQAACPNSCHWSSTVCEATTYVVPGSLGRCRFAPCEPRICAAGQYLGDCGGFQNGTCKPCNAAPAGRFFTGPGRYSAECPSMECQNCSVGFYRAHCGGANGGTCLPCSAPPAGNFFVTHGGMSDSCQYAPCSGATCTVGHYLSGCGGTDKGTCTACTKHVAGHHFSSHGFLNDSCPTQACDASRCAVGTYLLNCGGRMAPANAGVCTPCSAPPDNYYMVSNGGFHNHCNVSRCYDLPECPLGQYRAGCGGRGNATSTGYCARCTNIAPGVHYISGAGNFTGICPVQSCDTLSNCPIGHFRVSCGSRSDPSSKGSCSASCPAPHPGYFLFEGCLEKACEDCGSAQYRTGCGGQNYASSGSCQNCPTPPAGKFFNLSMNTGCTPQDCASVKCGTGQYRTGCGGTSVGTCAMCSSPPTRFYITGAGELNASSCPIASCDELTPCAAGQYRKDCGIPSAPQSPGRCEPCSPPPVGLYYSGPGNSSGPTTCPTKMCIQEAACPPGQYRYGCGTELQSSYTNTGICKRCTDPPRTFYLNSSGGITDSCHKTSCHGAPACDTGFYRKDCGGHNHPTGYGTCVQCSPPPADRYYISHGYLNDSCQTETCVSAGECIVGEYRKDCGGENDPTSRGFCTNCTAALLPGNIWLTDGDLSDDCAQGLPTTTTAAR
eukprot:TRINITY_DN3208_c0_g1_i2.p1 TRINITY_DN3208_c0_g1~~TRINITY_DN3208_c0_g1_i2.p1  ORF type:complete len:1368 (+),score=137.95 TRINITY_DN3208_c0_g1_i2:135-4238(+)